MKTAMRLTIDTYLRQFMLALGVIVASVMLAGQAHAVLQIDITQGNVDPMPIAVTDFTDDSGRSGSVGSDMAGVISANLSRSGLFRPLNKSAFIEKAEDIGIQPRFGDWRIINAQALVTGQIEVMDDGRLKAEFRLWDVYAEQQITGLQFFTSPENWRRVAHLISDAIYERLTGESGYFDTRIVFISESGPKGNRVRRLAIMDQDGFNVRFLTDGSYEVLSPRFSPTNQEITYMSYRGNKPRVYVRNIETNQEEELGDFPGMTFAPRFSPDGNRVIMSYERNGVTDIYEMDLRTRQTRQLTFSTAIDTSPSYSPDGQYVVFNSDRGGSQQLYVMDVNGENARRISHGDGRYATPVWSPRGDLIAFTKIRSGRFHIGVMRPDGSGERLLTDSFLDEGPTWSPNGRVLMFWRQTPSDASGRGGRTQLWSVDLTGYNERLVTTPQDASDPAWSPLIR